MGFHSEFLVGSIDALTSGGTLTETFVGLIIIPIVGNAAGFLSHPLTLTI